MNSDNFHRQPYFSLEGQFLGFVRESCGKLKYLRIAVEMNEFQIKLSKESRANLHQVLVPGDWIQVLGESKQKGRNDEVKLKAYQVNKLSQDSIVFGLRQCTQVPEILAEPTCTLAKNPVASARPKAKILICQKSGCVKRGGKKLCQELEAALCDRGLQNHVAIKHTGCLKRCSSAPNMVLMPDKTRCSKMAPKEIADFLAKRLLPDLHTCNDLSSTQN
jgi:(2Fe-2S) ferredoxin